MLALSSSQQTKAFCHKPVGNQKSVDYCPRAELSLLGDFFSTSIEQLFLIFKTVELLSLQTLVYKIEPERQ